MGKDDPRDELIRELEGMLIQSMADAEAIADAAERRRLADLEAQELRLLTDRHQEQRRTAAFVSDASERVQAIRDAVKATHRAEGDKRLSAMISRIVAPCRSRPCERRSPPSGLGRTSP